jgi:hypothetical protein
MWYDTPTFHELLDATGDRPVRELIAQLDGCTGGKAGEIVATAGLNRATCNSVTRDQAERLLLAAREQAKQVNPKRLGAIGPDLYSGAAYACAHGSVVFGVRPKAAIPFAVEAWAAPTDGNTHLSASINRTPVTGGIYAARDKKNIEAFGCGLGDKVAEAPKHAQFIAHLNVITPYCPITSDGKEPDFNPFLDQIREAVGKAVRQAHRPKGGNGKTQKDIILDNLDAVIADVSGGGEFRFNARQLFYGLRPLVMEETGEELKIGNFTAIITDYEAERGEIPGMYREPRGSIYHPHKGETITLSTLMVESYERPPWLYNKVAYIEKEGASEALKAIRWPERHDCMPMSSKGFSTRAARDLIDKLAEDDEPTTVYAATDADAYGTMIYQTLQEETKARGARKIKIVHLGLQPWEAVEMGLQVETIERGKKRKPVADYVKAADKSGEHGRVPNSYAWEEWLQSHRVELNAMTTPQFIAWLDRKMIEHGDGKLVPPDDILTAELEERLDAKVRTAITERILREAGLEDQVGAALAVIERPSAGDLKDRIRRLFEGNPEREWRDPIEKAADDLSGGDVP